MLAIKGLANGVWLMEVKVTDSYRREAEEVWAIIRYYEREHKDGAIDNYCWQLYKSATAATSLLTMMTIDPIVFFYRLFDSTHWNSQHSINETRWMDKNGP